MARTDGQTDGQTDGGDNHNIPMLFKKRGDNQPGFLFVLEWPLPNSVLPASYFDDHEPADLDHCDLEDDLDMGNDELLKTTLELEKEYLLTTKPSMGKFILT